MYGLNNNTGFNYKDSMNNFKQMSRKITNTTSPYIKKGKAFIEIANALKNFQNGSTWWEKIKPIIPYIKD